MSSRNMLPKVLDEKSGQNSMEFRDYSDSGPFQLRNFHWNFIFLIAKFVPANSEHVPASLESTPTINFSDLLQQKMFPPFFFGLPKLHLLVLSRYSLGDMIILPAKITSTCFE